MRRPLPILLLLAAAACSGPRGGSSGAAGEARLADGVSVAAFVLDLPAERARELLGDRQGTSFRAEVAWLERLRAASVAADGEEPLEVKSPRLLLRDGGEGSISVVEPVSYVREWRAVAGGDPEPVRASVDDGLWIDARPSLGDGARVRLAFEVRRERVERPIASTVVDLAGSDRRVRVELPRVASVRVAGETTLGTGECHVVVLAPSSAAAVMTLAVLTAAPAELAREAGFRVEPERAALSITRP